ncbi:4-(cytidine 5'-diphospho)-2-C-methyl-D-erythritol kinase [Pseudoroseomonas globiformis]|uniref:4-diphosphocytidyl-2-C-methyl-D-erythritol kinase n=1 Tax=Teichococcus globiformis TaxID=2307229 RepID=A0ABV7FTX4_9PROT
MDMMEPAPAKVNLHLHVTGRRSDGYHELDSLAVFAGASDQLLYRPAAELILEIQGPEAAALFTERDNLVLRAGRLLADAAGVPGRGALVLKKALPVASGIGGGSADAAAALRLLDRAWGLGWMASAEGRARMMALAARLGADVPVCLAGRPALMQGIGETLLPAPDLPPGGMVLANPRQPLATPAVFRAREPGFSAPAELPTGWHDMPSMAATLATLHNDLEPAAVALCPAVANVLVALRALPGCLLARMSGSGATCFALFADGQEAARAALQLPAAWWRWGGGFTAGGGSHYSPLASRAGA